jgi:excinuclease UvrABC nuclease subunit
MKFSESGIKAVRHPETTGLPIEPGVYLLVIDDDVVYVGQGYNVWRRSLDSRSHKSSMYKFKHADIYVILHDFKYDLNRAEASLIRFLEPRMNGFITDVNGIKYQHFLVRHGLSHSKLLPCLS